MSTGTSGRRRVPVSRHLAEAVHVRYAGHVAQLHAHADERQGAHDVLGQRGAGAIRWRSVFIALQARWRHQAALRKHVVHHRLDILGEHVLHVLGGDLGWVGLPSCNRRREPRPSGQKEKTTHAHRQTP